MEHGTDALKEVALNAERIRQPQKWTGHKKQPFRNRDGKPEFFVSTHPLICVDRRVISYSRIAYSLTLQAPIDRRMISAYNS